VRGSIYFSAEKKKNLKKNGLGDINFLRVYLIKNIFFNFIFLKKKKKKKTSSQAISM
jgi:hypothetical protein